MNGEGLYVRLMWFLIGFVLAWGVFKNPPIWIYLLVFLGGEIAVSLIVLGYSYIRAHWR